MTDTETSDHPKWLLELENRKRKPRLAHEAGAGASCVICKDTCPGLDLHFWRKTCKNCKCSKDDHDVIDEDFPQFDLLFGSSKKYKKKSTLLHIHNRKDQVQEAFEWIPPDTTKEIAAEYMKALPVEKLPIKGSAGAALRRQLLQKQLPLHDIDYEVCDKLSDQEKKHFEKYLENIKKYVGQGAVTKMLSARPFDLLLMTPANATDMQLYDPQNKHDVQTTIVQLRTPSSFMSKTPYKKDLHAKLNNYESLLPVSATLNNSSMIPIREKCNKISSNCEIAKSEPVKIGVYNKGVFMLDSQKVNTNYDNTTREEILTANDLDSDVTLSQNSLEYFEESSKFKNLSISPSHSKSLVDDTHIAESILADALLPPSVVHSNDIIGSTLDQKDLMFIREKLTNKYGNQGNHRTQMPCNVPSFARDFDANSSLKNDVTSQSINSDNENDVKAVISITKYPSSVSALSQNNIQDQRQNSMGKKAIETKEIEAKNEAVTTMSQSLQSTPLDTMVSHFDLTENTSTPDPLSQTCTQYSNSSNHQAKLNNFTIPSTVINSEKLRNHVFPCQSTVYGVSTNTNQTGHLTGTMENLTKNSAKQQKCHGCEEIIRVGDVAVIAEKAKNAMWHPGCFVCHTCNELLVDLVYFYYKNKLYCGRDLASLMGIPRCFACDELIFLREYTVAEGHNYHVKHFCCWDCDIPLAGKQYTTENDRPLCLPCYQRTYAKTCSMCNNVIAADQQGVALKDLNFHATGVCFCCYICKKNLLQARTAIKDKKLFCSKECIAMFLRPTT
ncbi:testin LIM domain protein [Megalopta genalis]|uniref:testin LIM domain protein n=1 Tax=Megalopta genalis TaxID=115081 RepID=UPI003FCEEEA8